MRKPVTLITGASSGIGAAFAAVFAENGHATVLVARRRPELQAIADTIAARGWPRPHVIALDLGQPDATSRLAHELAVQELEPAIVVNNAGYGQRGRAAELDRARQLSMIDLNMRVLTDLSLRFIDSIARHGGGIINVGSIASFFPGPGQAVYHASKAYVLSFTDALHQELAPKGVKVTAVCPGPVPTEFHARAGIAAERMPRRLVRSAERVAREGYDGFMQGRRLVVTGGANRLIVTLYRFLPRALVLRLVEGHQLAAVTAEPPAP